MNTIDAIMLAWLGLSPIIGLIVGLAVRVGSGE